MAASLWLRIACLAHASDSDRSVLHYATPQSSCTLALRWMLICKLWVCCTGAVYDLDDQPRPFPAQRAFKKARSLAKAGVALCSNVFWYSVPWKEGKVDRWVCPRAPWLGGSHVGGAGCERVAVYQLRGQVGALAMVCTCPITLRHEGSLFLLLNSRDFGFLDLKAPFDRARRDGHHGGPSSSDEVRTVLLKVSLFAQAPSAFPGGGRRLSSERNLKKETQDVNAGRTWREERKGCRWSFLIPVVAGVLAVARE